MTGNEWNDVKARLRLVEDLAIAIAESMTVPHWVETARIKPLVDAIRAERKLAADHLEWTRQNWIKTHGFDPDKK